MDVYEGTDAIPISFSRIRNSALVTGLTVTVTIVNARSGASLLAATSMPETTGVYNYTWTHGLYTDTECLLTYTVGTQKYFEFIFITLDSTGSKIAT